MAEQASTAHFAIGSTVAIEAMKSLLLVNGGAATALIALTDKTARRLNYAMPVLLFGLAALLSSITMVVGYFSQLAYANHVLATETQDMIDAGLQLKRHGKLQRTAIGFLTTSLVCSAGAMAKAFLATG